MTNDEFKKLKVGDVCMIIQGSDAGRLCRVASIEGESVLVRSISDHPELPFNRRGIFKSISWRELSLISIS